MIQSKKPGDESLGLFYAKFLAALLLSSTEIKIEGVRSHREGVRRRALRSSFWEGAFYSIVISTAENFALVFAITRDLSPSEIGLLTTGPMLIGALGNLLIPGLARQSHLKSWLIGLILLQIAGIGLLLGISVSPSVPLFEGMFIALSIYWLGGLVASPLWIDWMSGWLPLPRLGRFFSRRSSILSLVTLSFTLLLAWTASQWSSATYFFAIVFAIGLIARFAALGILIARPNPTKRRIHQVLKEPQWRGIMTSLQGDHALRPLFLVLIASILFRFVANISSPYFLPYMMRDLQFSTATLTLIQAVTYISTFLFMSSFAENIRRFSLSTATQFTMFGIVLVSLAWTIAISPIAIAAIQFFNGLFWAGLDLCLILWIQGAFPQKSRKLMGAHLAFAQGGAVLGSLIGSQLINKFGMSHLNLIEVSTWLRASVALSLSIILGLYTFERASLWSHTRFFISLFLPYRIREGIRLRLNSWL